MTCNALRALCGELSDGAESERRQWIAPEIGYRLLRAGQACIPLLWACSSRYLPAFMRCRGDLVPRVFYIPP